MPTLHVPVMPREVLEALRVMRGDIVVDATVGGGGHALLVLEKILPEGTLLGFDADQEALQRFRERLERDDRYRSALESGHIILVHASFSELKETLRAHGMSDVSAIVADLGFSSDQLEEASRGFSFLRDGPLDMRLDPSKGVTAEELLRTVDEGELARILSDFGEVRGARELARAIAFSRKETSFETTIQLAEFVKSHTRDRKASIHPATKVFQALRIAVNREREVLEKFLYEAIEMLRPKGRIAVLSFHSGEERLVKRIFLENARGCVCPRDFPVCRCGKRARLQLVTKRAMVPSETECLENPRARSAKLRTAEKVS
ncbi:MAG: 16S rRNA (cytosine(1402)-N(4))-methyltransferase RsmH [Candidatus Moraniibacteriota bacterium]|nr:MAG: 16S rRNA (cytosine(1402)-N(4))-methyltransferase RsmH [Candidatus Moranbacteria bacterium]